MNPLNSFCALRAIVRLKLTTRALTRYSARAQHGHTNETPPFWHLNDRVSAALSDPHLPARYRAPADPPF